MPGFRKHSSIGLLVGVGLAIGFVIYQLTAANQNPENVSNQKSLLKQAVLGIFFSLFGALLPDILEPAVHPNHRGFFHSVLILLVVLFGLHSLLNSSVNDLEKISAAGLLSGYLSHLIADSGTPNGLPLT